ncbi:MAG: C1 family peptidase [Deltaproteobacteria bacterium]|nr:C1 family peptidase [Deltaproteobacteria bacterium]
MNAPAEVVAVVASKKKKAYRPAELGKALSYRGNTPLLEISPGKRVSLERADLPGPTVAEIMAAKQPLPPAMRKYEAYMNNWKGGFGGKPGGQSAVPGDAPTIPANDHRPLQSPIRDQALRNTCTAHAAVAAIEARARKKGMTSPDFSENHAFNIFSILNMTSCGQDEGVPTWKTAAWLTSNRICTESESPYVPNVDTGNCQTIPTACRNNMRYGFTSTFPLYGRSGGEGVQTINSTNVLESFIDAGFDVVAGFWLAGTDWNDGTAQSGVIDVQTVDVGQGPMPVGGYGGHAMVIVGYDRPGDYFILKNSWGTSFGHNGYAYVSYDYVRTYTRYGYVVMETTNP